ncbi:MAG: endonuclease III, partial [Candidatus Gracilibacteria bacterium]
MKTLPRLASNRRLALLSILNKTYPHPKIALNFDGVWQLLVAVILSAQCTDKRVNMISPALFKR